MNLHKAKGLEADVVFLADPCGGFNPRVDVHIKREGHKALGWFTVVQKFEHGQRVLGEHADWPQYQAAEQPFLAEEQKRLLYVAATRAREVLVVSRQTPPKGTPAWNVLDAFLGNAKELPVVGAVAVPPVAPADCSPDAQSAAASSRAAAHAAVNQPSWSITSVTAEAKHVKRMTPAPEPTEPGDATRVVAQDTPSHRADAGMAWGTLIHGLLEHAMRHQGCTRDDLRRLAMWLIVEEPQLRSVIDEALDTVERVAGAEFWRDAAANEHSVETPFTFARNEKLTNGVIDLLHSTAAGWRITDYKTDADGGAAKASVYAAQLDAYRAALESCGVAIEGVDLQSVRGERAL
jgi:ATP-dependent helicase/nuclease subunit A